jgi:hypothetical protein
MPIRRTPSSQKTASVNRQSIIHAKTLERLEKQPMFQQNFSPYPTSGPAFLREKNRNEHNHNIEKLFSVDRSIF